MKLRNKIFLASVGLGMGLALSSCSDYLDTEKYMEDEMTEDRVFDTKTYTMEFLTFCYNRLQGDNVEIGHSDICPTNFCDDQTFNEGSAGSRYRAFKLGEIGYGYNTGYADWYQQAWPWSYDGIRQASIFIQKAHANDLQTEEEIDVLKAEARFLRAYFYWMLVRRYGPVPLMPVEGTDYTKSYDELSYPRNTMDECVDFIDKEMLEAAKVLPDSRDNANIARPTKGSALGVRAKVLVYAASPLYNGNTEFADFVDNNGKQLIPQEYSEEKWAKAAAACRDLIDYADATGRFYLYTVPKKTTGGDVAYPLTVTPPTCEPYSNLDYPNGWADIDPFESYRALFDGELYAAENPELLFTRGRNGMHTDQTTQDNVDNLARHEMPVTAGGWNIHGMTQAQCDAYDMADGTPFDREKQLAYYQNLADQYGLGDATFTTSANKALHPYDNIPDNGVFMGYANREPRFYASCAYSGFIWACTSSTETRYQNQQVWYYRGEENGRTNGNERWCNTGIGICKYVHPQDSYYGTGASIQNKVEPTLRYADILLMYTEALNNLTSSYQVQSWDGSTTYTVSRDVEQMRRGVKPVRMRAGVPDYSDETYADKTKLFEAIVHERRIEFFNENQRYYDVRRWKIAPEVESAQIYGCNTLMNKAHATEFYTPVRVPDLQTSFSRRQYFWPITYSELKKNKNMTQAPGWQDYD